MLGHFWCGWVEVGQIGWKIAGFKQICMLPRAKLKHVLWSGDLNEQHINSMEILTNNSSSNVYKSFSQTGLQKILLYILCLSCHHSPTLLILFVFFAKKNMYKILNNEAMLTLKKLTQQHWKKKVLWSMKSGTLSWISSCYLMTWN